MINNQETVMELLGSPGRTLISILVFVAVVAVLATGAHFDKKARRLDRRALHFKPENGA